MDLKQEIRILNSTAGLIESYVNYAVCSFPEDRTELVKSVLPKDHIAKKYFFILLLDVIAGVHKEIIPGKQNGDNLLSLLFRVSENSLLNHREEELAALSIASSDFMKWLEHEFEYSIYSANIEKDIEIQLSRKDALYLIGNRCKHSLLRSNSLLNKLVKIYKQSGVELDTGTEVLIMEDIDTWLFDDFGGYHFTKLCDLSAKVYYGIIRAVRPVYKERLVQSDDIMYSYNIPDELADEESKFEFYELLNRVRSPFIPAIETWDNLEGRY